MLFALRTLPATHTAVVARIDALRVQLRYRTASTPRRWTGLLRRSTFARAIQGSNGIEGYNVTYDDAVAALVGEDPMTADAESWQAVLGYRDAMTYVLQLADDPFFTFNEGTLRSLHYMMLRHDMARHPGRWRPGSIFVRHAATGDIVYEGPAVDRVPGLMAELVSALAVADPSPPMVRAALAHLNLVMIHPFSDGNGRMARALQTLVLAREGILDPRLCSIEEYLGRNTHDYYRVLADVGGGAWHPENDPLPWIRFCLTAHYRQAQTLLRRTSEMGRVWDMVEAEVQRRGLPERTALALVDAAFGWRVRNASYRAAAEVTDNTASRDLKLLVDQGLLVPVGSKRGRSYAAGDWLRGVRERAREARATDDPFEEADDMTSG